MNVNELLQLMVKKGISDIHFKSGSSPLLRINGKLVSAGIDALNSKNIEDLANSLMNAEQKKIFESEQELDFSHSIEDVSRFRINVYRQRGTSALAMRVVPMKVQTFEELNLPAEPLRKLAMESRGLILIAGVTGAGKTTTLNAMLDYINENTRSNIVTVEDPIEYYHKDKKSSISQREVGLDTKSYARALKFALRQDPDIVVIGEMRDFEAMSAAITAAETGHLVLSTIHTMDASQTIDRIVDSYPPHQQSSVRSQFANIIKGIVAQRLVMRKDGEGRIPATEILLGTSLIKKLIIAGKMDEVYKTIDQGAYYGMHTFDNDLLELCKNGVITVEEALDKATNSDDMTLSLKGIDRGKS